MLPLSAQAVSQTGFRLQKYIFISGKNFDKSRTTDEDNVHIRG